MTPPASLIELSHNSASGNSVQFVIGQFICDTDSIESVLELIKAIKSVEQPRPVEVDDLIEVELTGNMKSLSLFESSVPLQEPEVPGNHLLIIRKNCFPKLEGFDKVTLARISQYSRKHRASIIDSLSQIRSQRKTLYLWLTEADSVLLCAYGPLDIGRSEWTSELALEILGITQATIRRSQITSLAVFHHFCGCTDHGVTSTPELVLQDLILQVIETRPSKFTHKVIQEHNLSGTRFREAQDSFEALWSIFWECVMISRLSSLVITLDNIDVLVSDDEGDKERKEVFDSFVRRLSSSGHDKSVVVKVLMTLRSPRLSRYLPWRLVEQSKVMLLKVSVHPGWNRMPPNTKAARVFRKPIEDDSSDIFDLASSLGTLESLEHVPNNYPNSKAKSVPSTTSDDEQIEESDLHEQRCISWRRSACLDRARDVAKHFDRDEDEEEEHEDDDDDGRYESDTVDSPTWY